MVSKIIPSIIAKNQKEFDERYSKVEGLSNVLHLDVMDGKFVKNKSLIFDLELPRKKYQVHLMVKDLEEFIKIVYGKADTIIFHVESLKNGKDVEKIIRLIRSKKKKVGIAINPKTNIKKIEPYFNKIDLVLIMTVNPGKYGSKFLPKSLKKISQIKKLNSRLKIGLDGGINPKTISNIKKYPVDFVIVGSYFQKSKDVKKALKDLNF